MGFDNLIVEGTVVTATDAYPADVAISGGKIVAVGRGCGETGGAQAG